MTKRMLNRFIVRLMLVCAAVMAAVGPLCAAGDGENPPRRPKVALVLCGGGAKGAAHIGALKVLEEANVPIDMIVGTSIGGLVGGLYAMGYSAAELDSIVSGCDWKYLLSDNSYSRRDESFDARSMDAKYLVRVPFYGMSAAKSESPISRLPSGFIGGQNVLNFLNGLAMQYRGNIEFKNLPVPFACVATDLSTGEAVVLDRGELTMAMRATMAIPGVFSPVEIDGRVLVDGGVVNNFPVDVARNMGADIVIGVDIKNDAPSADELRAMPQVFMQMLDLLGYDAYVRNVQDVDILIKPDVSKYGTFSFNAPAIAQLIKNGEAATRAKIESVDSLVRRLSTLALGDHGQPSPVQAAPQREKFRFQDVVLSGVPYKDQHWLRRLSGLRPGVELTKVDIDRGISVLMGTKAFSSVTYTIQGQGTPEEVLVLSLVKGPSNVMALGARYDSEEAAGMLVHIGANELGLLGSKVGFTGRLSYNPYGEVNYSYNSKYFPKIEFNYKVGSMDLNIYKSTENQNNLDFLYQRGEINLANIYLRNYNFKVGARYEHYNYSRYLKYHVPDNYQDYSLKDKSYQSFYFSGKMDNLDDDYFARHGVAVEIEGAYWPESYSNGITPFGAVKLMVDGTMRAGKRVVFLPHLYGRVLIGDCTEIPYLNYFGGSEPGRYFSQQLPFIGMNHANPIYNSVMIARMDVRRQFGSNHYVYAIANYLRSGMSIDEMLSSRGFGIWGFGVKYAYNSPIGPLSFNVHWSDYDHKVGAYVSLGHYF